MKWQTTSGGHSQVAVWPWGRPCIESALPAEPWTGTLGKPRCPILRKLLAGSITSPEEKAVDRHLVPLVCDPGGVTQAWSLPLLI